jgi:hypothetical protein
MTIGILKQLLLKITHGNHATLQTNLITQPSSKNIAHATFAARGASI